MPKFPSYWLPDCCKSAPGNGQIWKFKALFRLTELVKEEGEMPFVYRIMACNFSRFFFSLISPEYGMYAIQQLLNRRSGTFWPVIHKPSG